METTSAPPPTNATRRRRRRSTFSEWPFATTAGNLESIDPISSAASCSVSNTENICQLALIADIVREFESIGQMMAVVAISTQLIVGKRVELKEEWANARRQEEEEEKEKESVDYSC